MQVLFEDSELKRIRAAARAQRMTLAGWVRGALRRAFNEEPEGGIEEKLSRVRAASRCEFPTAEIDVMLAEIERGYGSGEQSSSIRTFPCTSSEPTTHTKSMRSAFSSVRLWGGSAW